MQPFAVRFVSPVVQNVWYTILTTPIAGRLLHAGMFQNNTVAAAQDCQIMVTTDDYALAYGLTVNPLISFSYLVYGFNPLPFAVPTSAPPINQLSPLDFHTLTVEMRITSAPALNQSLQGWVMFELYGVP